MIAIRARVRQSNQSIGITLSQALTVHQKAIEHSKRVEKEARSKAAAKIYNAYRTAQRQARKKANKRLSLELHRLTEDIRNANKEHDASLEQKAVGLAMEIAQSIIQSELGSNKQGILKRYQQLLGSLHDSEPIAVLCHKDMKEAVEETCPIAVQESTAVPMGDIAIRTSAGIIQTDVASHFASIKQHILDQTRDGNAP